RGTNRGDEIFAGGEELSLNGLTIVQTGIDQLVVLAGNGKDHVDVSRSEAPFVLVSGGNGRDTLIGRGENELLIGGRGRDVINGRTERGRSHHHHHDRDHDDWFDDRHARRGRHAAASPTLAARLIDGVFSRGLPDLFD
ncbi:MAG: hypothetical protein ACREIV_13770, partial [Planctomycetaceae bacterium]